jgi:hypothetical protein
MILDRFENTEQSAWPALAAGNYLVNKHLLPTARILASLSVHGTPFEDQHLVLKEI